MFGIDERLYVFHGAGAVERNHRCDVTQVGGLQGFDVTLHTGAFKLEQVVGVTRRQQFIGCNVIQGDGL